MGALAHLNPCPWPGSEHPHRRALPSSTRSRSCSSTTRCALRGAPRSGRRSSGSGSPGAGTRSSARWWRSRAGSPPSASGAATSSRSSATTGRGSTGPCARPRPSAEFRFRCTRTRWRTSSPTWSSIPGRASRWSRTRSRSTSSSRSASRFRVWTQSCTSGQRASGTTIRTSSATSATCRPRAGSTTRPTRNSFGRRSRRGAGRTPASSSTHPAPPDGPRGWCSPTTTFSGRRGPGPSSRGSGRTRTSSRTCRWPGSGTTSSPTGSPT